MLQLSGTPFLERRYPAFWNGGFTAKEYSKGRTYNLKLIPKEKEIYLRPQWLDSIHKADFSVSVSSEVVIKLLLWFIDRGPKMFTNEEVSNDLNISVTTINNARRVLLNDLEVITQKYVSTVTEEGEIHRVGQIIEVSAWMKE